MLKFKYPARDSSGHLLRMRNLAVSQDEAASAAEKWDAIVEYILGYVVEPEDRDEAREALWQMSEEEYDAAMAEIKGLNAVSKNT